MPNKKEREQPLVKLSWVEGLSEGEINENILALIGERPRKVRILEGGVYHVEFPNLSAAKMLAFHMREFEELSRPLLVSILVQPLPILELFEVLNDKLVGKERFEEYESPNDRPTREIKIKNPSKKEKKEGDISHFVISCTKWG